MIEEIIKTKAKIVLFDYFDTLVTRSINPEDIKRLACNKLANMLDNKISGDDFYKHRARIEAEICRRNANLGYDLEFNFLDFTDRFTKLLGYHFLAEKERIEKWIIEIEVALECAVQRIDPVMLATMDALKKRNIPIYIVSDFYLPSNLFRTFFEHHKINHLIKGSFISADYLFGKRSGRMYQYIISQLGHKPNELLMVGDNAEADIERAKGWGLQAILIDRSEQRMFYTARAKAFSDWELIQARIKSAFSEHRSQAATNQDNEKVFSELALTLYYFIEQLHLSLMQRQYNDVFFLSREGQFLQKLFDTYQALNGYNAIKSHYFEVSRRSTFLPSLRPLDREDFHVLFRQYHKISGYEFLENLGLGFLCDELATQLKTDLRKRENDFPSSWLFLAMRGNALFRQAYAERRKAQFAAFCQYLNSFSIGSQQDNTLVIVDVGWKGSIQDNLSNFLIRGGSKGSQFTNIDGFYLGLVAPGDAGTHNPKIGLVFSSIQRVSKGFRGFTENQALFEVALGADHGSVREYAANGPVHDDYNEEKDVYETYVRPLQDQLLLLFEQIAVDLRDHSYSPAALRNLVIEMHSRMVLSPTSAEIAWMKNVYHLENFGVFETSRFSNDSVYAFKDRLKFSLKLASKKMRPDLGFWPLLTIKEKALPFVDLLYSARKLRLLRNE
jgi:predicted HAD superfamily hydrolase